MLWWLRNREEGKERAYVVSWKDKVGGYRTRARVIDIDFVCVCVCVLSREQRTRGEEEEDTGRMMEERAEEDGESRERLSPSRVI